MPSLAATPTRLLDALLADGTTVVFVEELADAVALERGAPASAAWTCPATCRSLALGDPTRAGPRTDIDFTGFRIPRARDGPAGRSSC